MRRSADIIELYAYLFISDVNVVFQSLSHTLLSCLFCSVGTVTMLWARRPKNRVLAIVRVFLLSETSRSAVGSTWLSTGDSFPGIKVAVTCI